MTTIIWDVSMESAEHQTTVLVKLDGRDLIAIFVCLCQVVIMVLATMPLNATVKLDGREHSATSPAVKTAPMDFVSHLTNVSAQMGGPVRTVMSASLVLDANMELAEIIPTPVSVKLVGRVCSVINHHAVWIAIMESATLLAKQTQPTFACANLDGKEQAVTFADLTGDVPTRVVIPVTIPMNVSASTMRSMLRVCATTQP